MSGNRYWLVPVSGFDDQVVVAATTAKAKGATLKAAKDAGYFAGREGSARFFAALGHIREINESEARSRIGGHRPIGAGSDWALS